MRQRDPISELTGKDAAILLVAVRTLAAVLESCGDPNCTECSAVYPLGDRLEKRVKEAGFNVTMFAPFNPRVN